MSTDTSFGRVTFFDDFNVDTLSTFAWTIDDITSGTNFAINVQVNGVARGVAGTSADQGVLLRTNLAWEADDGGPLVMEARFKPETDLGTLYYVGFTDEQAGEIPISYNGGSLATNAADAAGFYYAGAESNATWRCGGVAGDVDSAQTAASAEFDPALTVYQTFRVVVNEEGAGSFYINGNLIVEGVSGCLTPGTAVMPVVGVFKDDVSSGIMDLDYMYCSKGRV